MANSTKLKHHCYLVEWIDAESIDEWTFNADVDHSIAPVKSIGWLIFESHESVTLALNWDTKNEAYSCMMKIPRGMIVKIKKLKS